jgi:hypothetical protein
MPGGRMDCGSAGASRDVVPNENGIAASQLTSSREPDSALPHPPLRCLGDQTCCVNDPAELY